ncbi:MAG: aminotransferase class I/II-fold pyridoxal phosphate-dependent enzyme [Vibrionaceae bacterium]|nr:aminotransferase class I/II-fold pyridoxal phosphate-dependent enzyme [Vibrionaceae bacterium]
MERFTKSFTQQGPIPEEGIALAVEVMRSGRLHRYNVEHGEKSTTDQLELAFAQYMGVDNCLACASCGYALHIAMRSVGVGHGDKVLCNAFTLAPVPGAIHNTGATPVLVEIDENLCIDLDDLEYKADQSGAKFLLLSHMRGHIADMDKVIDICHRYDLTLIEDCAHTMGAKWNGKLSGSFGDVACFSTQTYKHMNSGEGGLLVTPHKKIMARAIIYSGSYMLYDRHHAAPERSEFDDVRLQTPNYSGRMDNLRAATLLPQIVKLDEDCKAWNLRHDIVAEVLATSDKLKLTKRPQKEQFVASSIQFSLPTFSAEQCISLVERCAKRGVVLKWFGSNTPESYTSKYDSWAYLNDETQLVKTDQVLSTLIDMRLPLTFDEEDCSLIAKIIVQEVEASDE